MDFQHQRFEVIRVRRPLLRAAVGVEPAPSAGREIPGVTPIGNGLLAQVIEAIQ